MFSMIYGSDCFLQRINEYQKINKKMAESITYGVKMNERKPWLFT